MFTLVVYLLTRVPVLATVAYYLHQNPRTSVTAIVLRRDGWLRSGRICRGPRWEQVLKREIKQTLLAGPG